MEGEALKEVPKVDADQCRRAIPLTPDIPHLLELFQVLAAFVVACGPSIFNPWRVLSGNWNLLFNKPPCQQQIYHKDYDAVIKDSSEDIGRGRGRGRGRRGAKANRDMPPSLWLRCLCLCSSVWKTTPIGTLVLKSFTCLLDGLLFSVEIWSILGQSMLSSQFACMPTLTTPASALPCASPKTLLKRQSSTLGRCRRRPASGHETKIKKDKKTLSP